MMMMVRGSRLVQLLLLLSSSGTCSAQYPLLPKRLRMVFAFGGSAPQSQFVSYLQKHPGVINIASAYCYTLRDVANLTKLPDYQFCSNFTSAVLKMKPRIYVQPVIQMGGSFALENFDQAAKFAALFVPEAAKYGYSGYFIDCQFKGDRVKVQAKKYAKFLDTFGKSLHAVNLSLTVLTTDLAGNDENGPIMNQSLGLDFFVAEKTADRSRHGSAADIAREIPRLTGQYYAQGLGHGRAGELLYPHVPYTAAEVAKIFTAMDTSKTQELSFWANFRNMDTGGWLSGMKNWLAVPLNSSARKNMPALKMDDDLQYSEYLASDWAHIPRYVFPCYAGRAFNETELQFLARFSLVVLCHTHRTVDNQTLYAEDAMALTALKIRKLSATTRVLFYINSALDYQDYAYHHKLLQRPDLWLRWGKGKNAGVPYYINCIGCPITDFSQQAGRDFFIAEYINATTAHSGQTFAGLFADRAGGAPTGCYNESGYLLGHKLVFQELQLAMAHASPAGSLGKYVVTNNVAYPGVSGTMLEGFRANETQLITHRAAAAGAGRLVLIHAGYALDGGDDHCHNITNALAGFLVSAGPGSMFGCSRGWTLGQGWLTDHPAFHRPLGVPLSSSATISSGVWRREFASGTVATFNANTGVGHIKWASSEHSLLPAAAKVSIHSESGTSSERQWTHKRLQHNGMEPVNHTRHSAWWRPVGCGNSSACQNKTLTSLRRRFGSWDTFSPTVARVYNGSKQIVLAPLTVDVKEAIAIARQVGYRIVPIVEVDCGKVIGNANATQDFKPSIDALVSLAAEHCFNGYTLDMICGDLEKSKNTTTARFVTYVNLLSDALHNISSSQCVGPADKPPIDRSMEVNWFAHGGYKPQAALPNKARSCFSEDTYRCKELRWTLEGVRGWVAALGSEAGIGLEPSPTVYFESAALHGLVSELLRLNVRSIGTWGTFENNKFADLWATALQHYLLGNSSGLPTF
jgi:hypothetical protein